MSSWPLLFLPPQSAQMRQLFPPAAFDRIRELTTAVFNTGQNQLTEEELIRRIPGVKICVTGWGSPKISERVLTAADSLKAIIHSAGTVKPYICEEVFRRGITVTSANAAMSRTTAEATFALMTIGSWNTRYWVETMAAGGWKTKETTVPGMQGKTIGLIGYGAVTRALLPLLAPLRDVTILIASGHLTAEAAEREGLVKTEIDELLARADIISLQTSLTPETRRLMDTRRLSLIRPGALFVNIGRGELVDEAALAAELSTGRFRAALDVYDDEPLSPESVLRKLPNVICFPHLGAATEYCRLEMGRDVVRNIEDIVSGREPASRVAPQDVFSMSEH